jgi:hypothetical protein
MCPPSATGDLLSIWKYSAVYHILGVHSEENPVSNSYKLPRIPGELMVSMFIERKEEELMDIEAAVTKNWRDKHGIPGSDDIKGIEKENSVNQEKRERSSTMSSVGRKGKRRKEK